MAGESKTSQFNIGNATVCIGEAGKTDLTPATNSIGLVKDFTFNSTKEYAELTEGTQQSLVSSTVIQNIVNCSFQVYEYTAQNLAYALGLDGGLTTACPVYKSATKVEGSSVETAETLKINSETDISANFPAGANVVMQAADLTGDNVIWRVCQGSVYTPPVTIEDEEEPGFLTITLAESIPTDSVVNIGDNIYAANLMLLGSAEEEKFFSLKIIQVSQKADKPWIIYIPKARIVNGFNVGSQQSEYASMTWEVKPYAPVSSDEYFNEARRGVAWLLS